MRFNSNLAEALIAMVQSEVVPFLVGEAGIGKTSFIKAEVGAKAGSKVFVITANQLSDVGDLCGVRTVQGANGTYRQEFFPHAIITEAIEYATANPNEIVILFVDEINRCASDITSALLSLVLEHRLGDKELPSNIRYIAAGNDDGNIYDLDSASLSRFCVLHVQPDITTLRGLKPWTPIMQSVLSKMTDNDILAVPAESNGFVNITTPRTIFKFDDFLTTLGQTKIDALINANQFGEIVSGFLGTTDFAKAVLDEACSNVATAANAGQNMSQFNTWKLDSGDLINAIMASGATDIEGVAKSVIDYIVKERACIVNPMSDAINNFDAIISSADSYLGSQQMSMGTAEKQNFVHELCEYTTSLGQQVQGNDITLISIAVGGLSTAMRNVLRVGMSNVSEKKFVQLTGLF